MAAIVCCTALAASAFRTDTVKVATRNMPSAVNVTVIVPDGEGRKFPTVYLLNGFSGDHRAWGRIQPRLGELADTYGMVMVMPDGQDTWYWDSPARPEIKMESFFINDLVPYIDANYPTEQAPAKRAITGLSMGGHGAFWLGTRHPDIFGNIGSMSGGVDIRPFPKNWKMASLLGTKEQNPQRWDEYTVASLVPQIARNGQNITFDCGSDDFFYTVNNNLHRALLDAKVPHDYTSRPGGHTFAYWANSILYHLLYFNQAFNK